MGNNAPIRVKCWLKFLESKKCIEKRSKGSHHQYWCPGCKRPIPVYKTKKELPFFHVREALKTLNVPVDVFLVWKEVNC